MSHVPSPVRRLKAVQVDTGVRGRGVIAPALADAGYDIVFVDAERETVDLLNEAGRYRVMSTSAPPRAREVVGVRAVDRSAYPDLAAAEIATADVACVAVNGSTLPSIARTIVAGLGLRGHRDPLLILVSGDTDVAVADLTRAVAAVAKPRETRQDSIIAGSWVDGAVCAAGGADVCVEQAARWSIDRIALNVPVQRIPAATYVHGHPVPRHRRLPSPAAFVI